MRLSSDITISSYITTSLFSPLPRPPSSTLFPYTTLFRSSPAGSTCRRSGSSPPTESSRSSPSWAGTIRSRSEEHTSELQSHHDLVCRLLLEKKKIQHNQTELALKKT